MNPLGLLSHAVLARHGFADLINQLDLPAGFWKRLLTDPAPPHTIPERARLAAEELGPTFVKLEQFLTINLQHRGLEAHDDAMKVAANRIALGVIIGSLIIGSSLVIITGIQPHLFGYPALGIVGYLLSALLGLYVVWDIIRHGRHK